MQQAELKSPFGTVNMYKNSQQINFEAEQFSYGIYLNDNTLKKPQGLYKLYPNMEELKSGDIIICEFDKRVLPYETWGSTERGFEIHIIDAPEKYLCEKEFQKLCFVVAWESGTTDEAWELISFVTC